jgi:hypothetical protein
MQSPFGNRRVLRTWQRTSAGTLLLAAVLVSPALARPATQDRPDIAPEALQQIAALQTAKSQRTPVQQKIDSNLLLAVQQQRGEVGIASTQLITGVEVDTAGTTLVDVRADVTDDLLAQVRALGGEISYTSVPLRTVVARVPLNAIEQLATSPQVRFVLPHRFGETASQQQQAPTSTPQESFKVRAERVRNQVRAVLQVPAQEPVPPAAIEPQLAGPTKVFIPAIIQSRRGNVSQGDTTHRAALARSTFAVTGAGITIGVLSDGVDSLARAQASGDLPAGVRVLPGQAGAGDEGTAMLEIVHDLAPGAELIFATGFSGIESFADNIRALRAAGADIIVDDIGYFVESPFQLGQAPTVISQYNGGVVSQAVNDVVANGALYFSSAGNSGNLNDGTSGVWEGNFVSGGATTAPLPAGSTVHDFVPGTGVQRYNVLAEDTTSITLFLHWSDPLGAASNDYDLYLLDAAGTQVLAASDVTQDGTQDPVEAITGNAGENLRGSRIVVVKYASTDQVRYLHLNTNRGLLQLGTDGQIYGHPAVPAAVGVAATPAGQGATSVPGPFPGAFNSSNVVESFSSDGPRQFFYRENSTPITGSVVDGGGTVVLKPDLTAADGVSTQADPQEAFNPFYGTSAAAPHAAAIAALVQQANPALTPQQVLSAMRSTAIDIEAAGFDRDSGVGIVDAYRAVDQVK